MPQILCTIEDFIAISSVLCPEVIEVKGHNFISEFYQSNLEEFEEQFNGDRKQIEQFINTWSLGDFFLEDYTDSVENKNSVSNLVKF
ncbi:hypothetical protein WAK64_05840 [Bacillus spongiae]|uniref:Uncharacterized protein n=1 Tax=Bacillus spongiae TaxID=2683610 RepID=A0ABU8HBF9_9BACI